MAAYVDVGRPNRDVRKMSERLEVMQLDPVENLVFEGRDVYLDGRLWRRCTFRRCRLFVYFGRWRLEESQAKDCEFLFADSAQAIVRAVEQLTGQQVPRPPNNPQL